MSISTLPHKTVQKNVHNNNKNVIYVQFCSGISIQNILKLWRFYGDWYSSYKYSTFKKQFFLACFRVTFLLLASLLYTVLFSLMCLWSSNCSHFVLWTLLSWKNRMGVCLYQLLFAKIVECSLWTKTQNLTKYHTLQLNGYVDWVWH